METEIQEAKWKWIRKCGLILGILFVLVLIYALSPVVVILMTLEGWLELETAAKFNQYWSPLQWLYDNFPPYQLLIDSVSDRN